MDAKQVREKMGLSQSQMAKLMNTHPMMISKWERGETKPRGQAERLLELLAVLHDEGLLRWYVKKFVYGAKRHKSQPTKNAITTT